MDLKKITESIEDTIKSDGLKLFSVRTKVESGLKILEILLDGSLTSDSIENIHYKILDSINDLLSEDYYLEVSSVGAEREIRNETEMLKFVGSYINVKSDYYSGDGTLTDFKEGTVFLKTNQKGKYVTLEIPYNKISKARLAIKF